MEMKRTYRILGHLVLLILLFTSCMSKQERFLSNFSDFVANVEAAANTGELTTADWDILDEEFKNYHMEYQELSKSFTKEQQREAGELYTKYAKLRLVGLGDTVNDYCGFLEGIVGELGGSFDSIGELILGFLDGDGDVD